MAKPLHVQIIPRARALIEDEDHWCRGGLARDKYGSVGASHGQRSEEARAPSVP